MRFDELPRIRGVVVDVDALRTISHRCDPRLCSGSPCCASGYEVCVDEEEAAAIVGMMPAASRCAEGLATEDGLENVFEELFPGLLVIDTDERGLCVFAYRRGRGPVLCSLHSAAVAAGVDVGSVKPRACRLWPLAMTDSRPHYLGVDPGAMAFPCNTARPPETPGLDDGVAAIVRDVLGEDFLAELLDAMEAFPS